jgi:acetyltransferase-like isoleucine patch superfamily enzyme
VLLDDRGEIIIHEGSSVSDYANVYSHAHDLNDGMLVDNHRTEIGPKARITYHATVLSGVKVAEHGMVGSMGVASKNVEPFQIVGGIPAKPIKIKPIAPEELRKAFEKR